MFSINNEDFHHSWVVGDIDPALDPVEVHFHITHQSAENCTCHDEARGFQCVLEDQMVDTDFLVAEAGTAGSDTVGFVVFHHTDLEEDIDYLVEVGIDCPVEEDIAVDCCRSHVHLDIHHAVRDHRTCCIDQGGVHGLNSYRGLGCHHT